VPRVARVSATGLFSLIALSSAGCLLYTDPINEPPRVKIAAPDRAPSRSAPARLSAEVEDDDTPADQLRRGLVWSQVSWPCDRPPAPATVQTGESFEVVARDVGRLCVTVTATDSRGATGSDTVMLDVMNHAPVAVLRANAPRWPSGKVRLYARVELSAAESHDQDSDPLGYTFTATGPDGKDLPLMGCDGPPADDARRCFSASAPGHYQAALVARDGLADSEPAAAVAIDVDEDHPPCLLRSDPLPLQPLVLVPRGGKRTFEVLAVDDDGEPLGTGPAPLGPPVFVWSKADDGKPMVRLGGSNAPRMDVSEGLFDVVRPGDQPRVRVEVRDRIRDEQLQQRLVLPPCPEDTAVCMVDGCLRWTTWKVQFFP
jgi:hypothetical protein